MIAAIIGLYMLPLLLLHKYLLLLLQLRRYLKFATTRISVIAQISIIATATDTAQISKFATT